MNKIFKKTVFSVATCALLLSLQGCGEDRAGIALGSGELGDNSLGTQYIAPADRDGDGISDTDEKNGYVNACGETFTSDPDKWDSDGDGMSDGYEKTHSYTHDGGTYCTYPTDKDRDKDGIEDGDEQLINVGSSYKTDPTDSDTDNDGLLDGYEINTSFTDPTDKDSDDDRLSDGYETNLSHTDPNNKDTDGDGVTDGIEVCGTSASNQDGTGKIVSTDDSSVNPNTSNNFYDDILNLANDDAINKNGLNGFSDSRCQSPANYNSNDNPDKIDALDKTNDSDGDGRPNDKEKERAHNTDPLHAGKDYNLTTVTADVNDSISNGYYYSWITQTSDGQKMVKANFVYVPKADSKGFWVAKYLSVFTDDNKNSVKFVNGGDKVDNRTNANAQTLVENSKTSLGINTNISLPTFTQYKEIFAVKSSSNNDCITIKNSVGDTNMPKDATDEICEIIPTSASAAKQEFKDGGTVYIKSDGTLSEDSSTNRDPSTHFRAATGYVQ